MPTVNWTPETGYPPNTPFGTLPWRPHGAGVHLGFTIVLDAEVQEFFCSTSACVGFKVRAIASTTDVGMSFDS
jgi:amiloride-sensitive sodium channel